MSWKSGRVNQYPLWGNHYHEVDKGRRFLAEVVKLFHQLDTLSLLLGQHVGANVGKETARFFLVGVKKVDFCLFFWIFFKWEK